MKKLICFIFILSYLVAHSYSQCVAPNLTNPPNGSNIYTLNPTLQWSGASGNFLYEELQVATEPNFYYPFINASLWQHETNYTVQNGLQYNLLYYWRVGLNCYPGYFLYSSTYSFMPLITGIKQISNEIPANYNLLQNYPNPFNPTTNIEVDLPKNTFTKLIIYDITGREIQTLVNEELKAGRYIVEFSGNDLSSGMYFYKLITDEYSKSKKMILIK